MNREKGIAYCGLACCLCSENQDCAGCRQNGCKDKNWCKSFACCQERHLPGCWACAEFDTCDNFMLRKPKIHAFAQFIAQNGEETLLHCLAENEARGVIYHRNGTLIGDYDCADEAKIHALLLHGPEK